MGQRQSLPSSSLRTQGPITTGLRGYERSLPQRHNETTRRMGPRVRRDDGLGRRRTHPSSPGLTGRSSTPRRLGGANSLSTSSLRTQGPIATGLRGYGRCLPQRHNETTRRMGPRVRGDDGLRHGCVPYIHPSSPGLTGRSSTPRLIVRHSGARVSANPESRGNRFSYNFEIPDRSAVRTVRNDGEA
jgi:hypothetical protein